jgi:hypothetical protein
LEELSQRGRVQGGHGVGGGGAGGGGEDDDGGGGGDGEGGEDDDFARPYSIDMSFNMLPLFEKRCCRTYIYIIKHIYIIR